MKKYVHKLLTDCLNLSCIGTLFPQVSNDMCITISDSYGQLILTKTDTKQCKAYCTAR